MKKTILWSISQLETAMHNVWVQRVLLYLSIQLIAILEGLWLVLNENDGIWEWRFLAYAPAQLANVWILLIESFPNAWAWVYVIAVRAIRRREFAEEPWSARKRLSWLIFATVFLVGDTVAFVTYRFDEPDVWKHVFMMLLALPLLLLPVGRGKSQVREVI